MASALVDPGDLQGMRDFLIPIAAQAFNGRMANVSAMVVALWDYVICLDQEIDLVWKRRWTFITLLYAAVRYTSILGGLFFVVANVHPRVSTEFCHALKQVEGYAGLVIVGLAGLVMAARVYALYSNSRVLFWLFAFILPAQLVGNWVIWSQHYWYVKAIVGQPLPGVPFHVCFATKEAQYLWVWWLPPICKDILILGLVLAKAISVERRRAHGASESLVDIVVRGQLLYYITVIATELTTMMIWHRNKGVRHSEMEAGTLFVATLSLTLCCRLVLSLRDTARSSAYATTQDMGTMVMQARARNGVHHPRGLDSMGIPRLTILDDCESPSSTFSR